MFGSAPLSVQTVYSASLLQGVSVKREPTDAWGNVKIPRLERSDSQDYNDTEWRDVPAVKDIEDYTSLLGVPVVGIGPDGVAEFTTEHTYVTLSCPNSTSTRIQGNTLKRFNFTCLDCTPSYPFEIAKPYYRQRVGNYLGLNFTIPSTINETLKTNWAKPRTLEFGYENENLLARTRCNVKQRHVEAKIKCTRGTCSAVQIRPSQSDHRDPNSTLFDYWGPFILSALVFSSNNSQNGLTGWPSPTELFLNDSASIPVTDETFFSPIAANYSTIPTRLFADRAAMVLNTHIQIFLSSRAFAGDLPSNISLYGPQHAPIDGLEPLRPLLNSTWYPYDTTLYAALANMSLQDAPFIGASTTANVTTFTEVYAPNYAWIAILLSASVALFVTGVCGVIASCSTRVPNMLDAVAGLTYENKYFDAASAGSVLDAGERVKRMRTMRVQIADVNADGEVGKIAFTNLACGDGNALRCGRLYRQASDREEDGIGLSP